MTGEKLKEKLLKWGFQLSDIAEKMDMTPQAFHSKLDIKDLKLSFIIDIATAIKKNVYEIIEVPPAPKEYKNEPITDMILAEPSVTIERFIKEDNLVKMPVLDMQFAAGVSSYAPDNLDSTDFVFIPRAWLKKGKAFACGRIRGESMAPTLLDSGYGIIRQLSKAEWNNMPNEEIYVVVSKDGQNANVQVKRVKNRFDKGFIVMMSDNPDKASYPNFNLYSEEIISIWHMDWYFTSRMPNIHNQYYSRLQSLEDKVEDLFNELKPKLKTK